MNVYWLEGREVEVPVEDNWLSANEAACLNAMRFPKRHADWRLGRWTAKCALSVYLDMPAQAQVFKKIEIRPAPSGAPEVFLSDKRATVTISLSHRAGVAMCAVATSASESCGSEIGCDVELVEPRSDAFIADYFTLEERALVSRAAPADRLRLLALLWSAKESALKALRAGLRLDTRSVMVDSHADSFDINGWGPLRVRYNAGRFFYGWWQQQNNIVRTVVAGLPPDPPIALAVPAYFSDSASRCA